MVPSWRWMNSNMYDWHGRLAHQNGDSYEGDWHDDDKAHRFIEMWKIK